jgi:quinolinate synthase
MQVLTLAHYYTTPEVQAMADYVGDSLELSLIARREQADRIVFAGVKFMAETAKILDPAAEVILPDAGSTCSLVTQTNVGELRAWDTKQRLINDVAHYKNTTHIMYINSSVEMKGIADIIVTSRNVDDVVSAEFRKGNKVIFSPDRNMGNYLNYEHTYNMPVWNAVCEVHDKFKEQEISKVMGPKDRLVAHPESPLPVLKRADFIGSTSGMLDYVEKFQER